MQQSSGAPTANATGKVTPFMSMEDSPMFRNTLAGLEDQADGLNTRVLKLTKGSRKYRDGIAELTTSQQGFADFLEEFCGGTDEESMRLGGPLMAKFVSIFRELGSFNELLGTQVELILVEKLQHTWLKGLLADLRENRKKLDRKTAEYDAARQKHLGYKTAAKAPSKWRKGDDPDKAHQLQQDMVHAQASCEEARFQCTRKLMEVNGRKRYEFLEAAVSAVDAHLRFFERGAELLKNLEPFLQHSLSMVDTLRKEDEHAMQAVGEQIQTYRSEKSQRDQRAAEEASKPHAAEKGPMQMTNGMSAIAASIEGYIRATKDSSGEVVTVLKQGYLLKRSSGMRREWKRRFFVLDSLGCLYYYSNKERVDNQKMPQNTVNLLCSTIKPNAEDDSIRFCFRVVSPEKVYSLQAEDELDAREWMEAIAGVISCLINSNIGPMPAKTQGKPAKPTHSRHSSFAASVGSNDEMNFSPMGQGLGGSGSPRGSLSVATSLPDSVDLDNLVTGTAGPTSTRPEPLKTASAPQLRPHAQTVNPLSPSRQRPASPNSPMDVLRRVPGNGCCVDCGAPDPEWASLNLGVLLCIECSGIHRRLGVHVSKVRSLTLDVKVWDTAVLGMMEGIGNAAANEVWEEQLQAATNKTDSWVWCDDDGDEEAEASGAPTRRIADALLSSGDHPPSSEGSFTFTPPSRRPPADSSSPTVISGRSGSLSSALAEAAEPAAGIHASGSAAAKGQAAPGQRQQQGAAEGGMLKPTPEQSLAVKKQRMGPKHAQHRFVTQADTAATGPNLVLQEQFIVAKYAERRFVAGPSDASPGALERAVWAAVEDNDLRAVVRAVAAGADLNVACSDQAGLELVSDANVQAMGGAQTPVCASAGHVTVLHCACRAGDLAIVEYLLQNGASYDKLDSFSRSPLHYSIMFDHPAISKQLLRRGANRIAIDANRRTALEMAIAMKGRIADEELFVMLSPDKQP